MAGACRLDLLQREAAGPVEQQVRRDEIAGARADVAVPAQADRSRVVRPGRRVEAAAAEAAAGNERAGLFCVGPGEGGLGTQYPGTELPVEAGIAAEPGGGQIVRPR